MASLLPAQRVDPSDGLTYTFEQLAAAYEGARSLQEIERYWHEDCRPMETGGLAARATPPADGPAAEGQADAGDGAVALTVRGCQHEAVGAFLRGDYVCADENHSRPVYRKTQQMEGKDVLLYFWDERDGLKWCGWWFGPQVGGDEAWAYNNERAMQPPATGWRVVPFDGLVDTTVVVALASSPAPPSPSAAAASSMEVDAAAGPAPTRAASAERHREASPLAPRPRSPAAAPGMEVDAPSGPATAEAAAAASSADPPHPKRARLGPGPSASQVADASPATGEGVPGPQAEVVASLDMMQLSCQTPAGHIAHQAVALPTNELWVIGWKKTSFRKEVWALSADTKQCVKVDTEGFPALLWGCAATVAGTNLIVCAGMRKGLPQGGACWVLDVPSRTWSAPMLAPGSQMPCGRSGAAACPVRGDPMVALVGGFCSERKQYLADWWTLDLQDLLAAKWHQQEPAEGFAPRSGHSATPLRGGALACIFGGQAGPRECLSDAWLVDWDAPAPQLRKLAPAGQPPTPRSQHAACAVGRDAVLIAGGMNARFEKDDAMRRYDGSIHLLDIHKEVWVSVAVPQSPQLARRSRSSAFCTADAELLLFGGMGPIAGSQKNKVYDDLYVLRLPDSIVGAVQKGPQAGSDACSLEWADMVPFSEAYLEVCNYRGSPPAIPRGFRELADFLRRVQPVHIEAAATERRRAACIAAEDRGGQKAAEARERLVQAQVAVRRAPAETDLQTARNEVALELHGLLTAAAEHVLAAAGCTVDGAATERMSALFEQVGRERGIFDEQAKELSMLLKAAQAGAEAWVNEREAGAAATRPAHPQPSPTSPPHRLGADGRCSDDLLAPALQEFDEWLQRAAGEVEKRATEDAVNSAFRSLAQMAHSRASNRDALRELGKAFRAAQEAVQVERALRAEGRLPAFRFKPLLAAGAAQLDAVERLLMDSGPLLAALRTLHQEVQDIGVILKPKVHRDEAVFRMRDSAAQHRKARRVVEDAERQFQREQEDGAATAASEAQLSRARAAKYAAYKEAAEATLDLFRLLPTFPEVATEFRAGLPPELMPIWIPDRTLADFDACELLEASNANHPVYRVSDQTGVHAVKQFNISPASLRTCWREAALLRRARHPHVVDLVAAFEDTGRNALFLQFPFYEHGPVDRWCAQELPGDVPRRRVLHEVLQALAHLHALRITHADVKPANILIGADGRARLADFDVSVDSATRTSSQVARARSTTARVGYTQGFMAPELLERGASPATDMFAFGATTAVVLPEPDNGPRDEFVRQLQEPEPARRLTAVAGLQHAVFQPLFQWRRMETRRCCIMMSELCGERPVQLEDGVLCGGAQPHFTCNECMTRYVRSAAQQDVGNRRQRQGQIFCPMYPTECLCPPYPDVSIARAVEKEAFAEYIAARLRLLEQERVEQLEAEMQGRIDDQVQELHRLTERERRLRQAVERIREDILTLKCPSCKQAFVDFEGCFALQCSRCQAHFCAWCLAACHGDREAHDHVRACRKKPGGANVFFGTPEQFEQAMVRRKRRRLRKYMRGLDEEVRQQVLLIMQRDLQGLYP